MSGPDVQPTPPDGGSSSSNPKLDDLLAHYVERLNSGERIDRAAILQEHPDLGPHILRELETYVEFDLVPEVEPALGTLGDYTLRRQIGRGGMGVVYEAWQGSLERRVALKVLPAGLAADTRATSRFLREAQVAAKLNHPQVVSVYGFGVEQNSPYYAMEYVDGQTLAQILPKIKDAEAEAETVFGRKDSAAYFEKLASASAGVADGLLHAHSRGVIHRDIKPSNLILDTEGRLRILDFGLARLEGEESLTRSGDFLGTPLYMSPEQARRRKIKVDHRTDIYSLGATMYEMLAFRPPFKGKDHQDTLSQIVEKDPVEPRKLQPRIPRDLETIVLKCLRKDPGDRYGTAEALAQDLRRFVRGDPVEARRQSFVERAGRKVWARRWPLLGLAGLGLVALLSGALLYSSHTNSLRLLLERYDGLVRGAVWKLARGRLSMQAGAVSERVDPQGYVQSYDLEYLSRGDGLAIVEAALEDLEKARSLLPERPEARYYRARAFEILGERDKALQELRQAKQQSPPFLPSRLLERSLLEGTGGGATPNGDGALEAVADDTPWAAAWIRAQESLAGHDWDGAASAYGELLDLERSGGARPDTAIFLGAAIEILLGRGYARLQAGRLEQAIEDFSTARDRWPVALEPDLLLGKAWYMKGDKGSRERAEKIFEEASARSGKSDEVSLWVSLFYGYQGNWVGASRWTKELSDPVLRDVRSALCWRFRGEPEKATAAANRAIESDPDNVQAHIQRACVRLCRKDKDFEGAVADLGKALEAHPDHPLALAILGKALFLKGNRQEGLRLSRRAVELDPRSQDSRHSLGGLLWDSGLQDEGDKVFFEALKIDPNHVWAQHNVARVYHRRGEIHRAIEHYERAIKLRPMCLTYCCLAAAWCEKGDLERALSFYRQGLDLQPTSARGPSYLAGVLFQKGHQKEGLAVAEKAVEIDAADPRAHQACGRLLHADGRLDRAEDHYRRAIELEFDPISLPRCCLAAVLCDKGDVKGAMRTYEKAQKDPPGDSSGFDLLIQALTEKGHLDEAIQVARDQVQARPGDQGAQKRLEELLKRRRQSDDEQSQSGS